MKPSCAKSRSGGFTLIELIVTILVAILLASIAVPSFQQLIANQRIRTASFDLVSALSYARSEAVKRNAPVTLRAGALADGGWATGWRLVDPNDSTKSLRSWGAISNLAVTEAASQTAVTFGLDGRVASGAAPKLQLGSALSIAGLTLRCIQVDLSGRPASTIGSCP